MGSTSGGRGVAPGRPACQRATRALRCATALRDTARPSAQTAVMGLAARPGRGVPAVHTFAPSGQLASGRWLAYAVSFGGSGCKRRGLPGLIGVFPTTNEEESPLRPTTILRRLLGVTQLNVENGRVAADGPLRSGCGRRGGGHGAGRAAVGRRGMTGGRGGGGSTCRGDGRRSGCSTRRGGCPAVSAGGAGVVGGGEQRVHGAAGRADGVSGAGDRPHDGQSGAVDFLAGGRQHCRAGGDAAAEPGAACQAAAHRHRRVQLSQAASPT